jgi:HK97 family phage portal protein
MGAICRLIEAKMSRRSGTYSPAQWLVEWVSGGETESATGVRVNEQNALKYTPFWAAVRIISGTLAALPFLVYVRLEDGGKKRQPDHPVYRLLHDRPNDYMDSLTFAETRQAHCLCYGNGYAEIQRDGSGRPVALWPLLPDRTWRRIKDDTPFYEVRMPDNTTKYLPDYNVLHIKGLGFDGYTGYDVVQYHKKAIAYGMAVKEYGARFFGNDASPGGTLEHPSILSDTAFKHLKESWSEQHKGLPHSHRMQILEEGMKFNKTMVDPEQAQALEVQKWSVDDCSRIFQIPPHKLGSMEFSKYNNVEQLQLDFVATTMLYWFRKWELECDYKLFMPSERKTMFCEILVEGLLRADIKTRTEALSMQKDRGIISANEWREIENRNPIEGGDKYAPAANIMGKQASSIDRGVFSAHRALIVGQLMRLITKQSNAKAKNGELKSYARTILADPLTAYASLTGRESRVKYTIEKRVCENIDREFKLEDAGILADEIMQEIGGNEK